MKYGIGYVILFLNNNIFEGEYLNGEKNGKGKEYDYNGQLIYEGEYLHGYKLNGKEYRKGIVVYEGDYFNGDKWNGKVYNLNGNLIYELIKGNGSIYEYNTDGELIFEGEYLNGKRNGKRKEFDCLNDK